MSGGGVPCTVRFLAYNNALCTVKSRCHRVPTWTGKPGKMGRHFPVRERSGNFEQTGKVRENHTKYRKTWGISEKCYLLFFLIFKLTVYYLLKWRTFSILKKLKIPGKWEKILEKSWNFVSPEKWEPYVTAYGVWCLGWSGIKVGGVLVQRWPGVTRDYLNQYQRIKKCIDHASGGTIIFEGTLRQPIIAARKRMRRLCFYRCLSVHRGMGAYVAVGGVHGGGMCGRGMHGRGCAWHVWQGACMACMSFPV